MLNQISIILVNPSHPGNIGAVARAMKNMGLQNLSLVAPKLFPHHEATARAAGADEILAEAKIFENLRSAIQSSHQVYALSARSRRLEWPACSPEECATKVIHQLKANYEIAIVFGRENSGLTNEELAECQYHVTIPSNPQFPSLNLAAAVQIIAYEIWQRFLLAQDQNHVAIDSKEATPAMLSKADIQKTELKMRENLATQMQMQSFFQHLQQTLLKLKVLNPKHPKMLMKRLRRIFNRALLDQVELNILRGILTAINKLESDISEID